MRSAPLFFFAAACWFATACPAVADPTATDLNNLAVQKAKEGNFKEAVSLLQQALTLDPTDVLLRKNLSKMLTDYGIRLRQEGDAEQALQTLEKAADCLPENGLAWVHLGELQYLHRNDFDAAIDAWRRAYLFVPDAQQQLLASRIAQAQRDQTVEKKFLSYSTDHFQVRIPDAAHRDAAVRVGQLLESEYKKLSAQLDARPSAMTVIVYSQDDFQRLAGRPDWAIGFYDGRIRVRLQDIETGQDLRILPHELAHAFLHKAYGSRLPVWVHEGYAQMQEPPRAGSEKEEEMLRAVKDRTKWVPLPWLDSRFVQPTDRDDVDRAYVQSKAAVAHLLERQGAEKFRLFLDGVARGQSVEQSFDRAFAPARYSRFAQGSFD